LHDWHGGTIYTINTKQFDRTMRKNLFQLITFSAILGTLLMAPGQSAAQSAAQSRLLIPDRVFDGNELHDNWVVLIDNNTIGAVGPQASVTVPVGTEEVRLAGMTLMPGMIEGHSHLLLHPYDEASWNDQVLRESRSLRVARGTVHARKTLEAGFTMVRDLGSEGADYADVGLRDAIRQGIVPGPRMLVAGRAMVATGSYGPKGFHPDFEVPLGAEPADGLDDIIRVTRDQIGKGADVVKIYADYRWGPDGSAQATYTVEEIKRIVEVAQLSGRSVVAHAGTPMGMMNAINGGVRTIEHGDGATAEVFQAMIDNNVTWYPTLAAGEAISTYGGWQKGTDPDPGRILKKKKVYSLALEMGVSIGMGSDVGVFSHGDNAWELELMVEYGMSSLQVLRAVTSVNAAVFGLEGQFGVLADGARADVIGVLGNPVDDISSTKNIGFVMKDGDIIVRQ
jgi:imidazolonepropionase-like amidohydrolase